MNWNYQWCRQGFPGSHSTVSRGPRGTADYRSPKFVVVVFWSAFPSSVRRQYSWTLLSDVRVTLLITLWGWGRSIIESRGTQNDYLRHWKWYILFHVLVLKFLRI